MAIIPADKSDGIIQVILSGIVMPQVKMEKSKFQLLNTKHNLKPIRAFDKNSFH